METPHLSASFSPKRPSSLHPPVVSQPAPKELRLGFGLAPLHIRSRRYRNGFAWRLPSKTVLYQRPTAGKRCAEKKNSPVLMIGATARALISNNCGAICVCIFARGFGMQRLLGCAVHQIVWAWRDLEWDPGGDLQTLCVQYMNGMPRVEEKKKGICSRYCHISWYFVIFRERPVFCERSQKRTFRRPEWHLS